MVLDAACNGSYLRRAVLTRDKYPQDIPRWLIQLMFRGKLTDIRINY